jgi:hypothetical protein
MSKALLASVFALAAAVPAVSLSGCSPEVPATPSFARDVQPIFNARCIRCHDETFRSESAPARKSRTPKYLPPESLRSVPAGCTPWHAAVQHRRQCVRQRDGSMAVRVDPVCTTTDRMPPAAGGRAERLRVGRNQQVG